MKNGSLLPIGMALAAALVAGHAAVITVTTTDNVSPPVGQTSLLQALTAAQTGDSIRFNIPGAGPHYILTPAGGYPLITVNNLTIDGYSQPGAVPNTNPILAANNAQIKIVLDSRSGNSRLMDNFPGQGPTDGNGYGDTEAAILGFYQASNINVRGLCFLAVPFTGAAKDIALYGVSLARNASGHVNGCWFGIDVDGQTLATGPSRGVTGFRYQERSTPTTVNILITNLVVGVAPGSANPRAEFNVFTGIPVISIHAESVGTRISGNFLNVYPSGLKDFQSPDLEGNIEIGRSGNFTLIGVDGDGVNDADERNVIAGTAFYDHNIEFYGQSPGTNIVIAGNYIGVGVDGTTRFTNGVPALNAGGGSARYRFGSNLDGVSDDLEGNVVFNNWPSDKYPAGDFFTQQQSLNFFDELSTSGSVSARGNKLVNNFPYPVGPYKGSGADLTNYMAKALASTTLGLAPVINTNSSTSTRLAGAVPARGTNYVKTWVDVYVVNNEGKTNGIAGGLFPELEYGFIQGDRYLGSFEVDGAADTNPAADAFTYDISAWNVTAGTEITLTANYYRTNGTEFDVLTGPFAVPAVLPQGQASLRVGTVTLSGANLILNWSGGTPPYQVQTRSSVTGGGAWSNVGAPTSGTTATVPIGAGPGYFRVQGQ